MQGLLFIYLFFGLFTLVSPLYRLGAFRQVFTCFICLFIGFFFYRYQHLYCFILFYLIYYYYFYFNNAFVVLAYLSGCVMCDSMPRSIV
jgi:hypothetical protein